MTDTASAPGGANSRNWLGFAIAALALWAGVLWLLRDPASANHDQQIAAYAGQCPRWVKLAEELLTVDGGVPERCEYVKQGGSVLTSDHIYKAAPNIEVRVTVADDPASHVPGSVVIRDLKSKASVTYNAEALALVK